LERFVADFASQRSRKIEKVSTQAKEKIAIVGSGPAGMSCAYHLARLHYRVTVFESQPLPGGMLRMGIPSYRLPKDVLDREISLKPWGGNCWCSNWRERLGGDIRMIIRPPLLLPSPSTEARVGERTEGPKPRLDLLRKSI
jgi:hypothetical protein